MHTRIDRFLTRRRVLEGTASLAAMSLLPGCGGGSSSSTASVSAVVTNPQKALSGPSTHASVLVASASVGTVGSNFLGFSLGKNLINAKPYSLISTNTGLVNLFARITQSTNADGPPVLRIGGSQVDDNLWSAMGAGGTPGQIAPSDIAALASFVAASGWQ